MIDKETRALKEEEKAKTRKRMQVKIDPDNYAYIPAKKQSTDYYDNETSQRVAIYVRVSTGDVKQTTSFELQKKYYEDFVIRHPNWTLVKIYADEGISGTSLAHRDAFNQMIADCKNGKIDLIITKSVSRFARNVMICIGMVRDLAEMKPPVGVFFESECIFSLNEDSQMALSFQATMAEEESHTRSRSMETSLKMRLDNGIPLTPKLLGYTHDTDGNLVINPEEAATVKLAFYMYLYGYSTQQIADTFIEAERKSYLGNVKWTAGAIVQILRNERHCGDVLTRKTFTPNYRDHKSKKNTGERSQSHYFNHHEAIISRDDFNAVQHMLDNAKYKNNSFLPELKVITSGLFKGFVTIYPRWAGFTEKDYYQAAASVYFQENAEQKEEKPKEFQIEVSAGEFDLRGFEITRSEFFNTLNQPTVTFGNKALLLNTEVVRRLGAKNFIELLVNPIEKKFAIRTTNSTNRQGVICSKLSSKIYYPKMIAATAFCNTLYDIFSWNTDNKYKIIGTSYEQENETAYIFDIENAEAYLQSFVFSPKDSTSEDQQPITPSGKRIRAIPQEWTNSFGKQYYIHELSMEAIKNQNEDEWKLRMEGQQFNSGKSLKTTGFEELKTYILQELNAIASAGV